MFLIPVRLYITQCIKNLNQQFYSVVQAQGIFPSIIDVLTVTVIIIMRYNNNNKNKGKRVILDPILG